MSDKVDDLIKLARNKPKEVPSEENKLSEAHTFVLSNNIRHGDGKILAEMIYQKYKEWKKKDFQNRTIFFKDFKKIFKQKRTTDGSIYYLDPESFDLSEDAYWKMRKSVRNERAQKKKEKEARNTKKDKKR
jgi:hypothetical protein